MNHYANPLAIGTSDKQQHMSAATHTTNRPQSDQQEVAATVNLYESISQAFNDALTYVPVLKTGLIHAQQRLNRYYEPVLNRMIVDYLNQANHADNNNKLVFELLDGGLNSTTLQQIVRLALTSTTTSGHHNDERPNEQDEDDIGLARRDPRSTYLFQFTGTSNFVDLLLMRPPDLSQPKRAHLNDDHLEAKKWRLAHKLSHILASFVESGEINDTYKPQLLTIVNNETVVGRKPNDHHQANGGNRARTGGEPSDRDTIVTSDEYGDHVITAKISAPNTRTEPLSSHIKWPLFNSFDQSYVQIIDGSDLPFDDATESVTELEHVNLGQNHDYLRRALFWANFISTLNCSRTQPIMAGSLLAGSHALQLDQTLHHQVQTMIDVQFTCQNGPRTSLDYLVSGAQNYFKSGLLALQAKRRAQEQQLYQQQAVNFRRIVTGLNGSSRNGSSQATRSTSIDNYNYANSSEPIGNLLLQTVSSEMSNRQQQSTIGANSGGNRSSLHEVAGEDGKTTNNQQSSVLAQLNNFQLVMAALLLGMVTLTIGTVLALKTSQKNKRRQARRVNRNRDQPKIVCDRSFLRDGTAEGHDRTQMPVPLLLDQLDANKLQDKRYLDNNSQATTICDQDDKRDTMEISLYNANSTSTNSESTNNSNSNDNMTNRSQCEHQLRPKSHHQLYQQQQQQQHPNQHHHHHNHQHQHQQQQQPQGFLMVNNDQFNDGQYFVDRMGHIEYLNQDTGQQQQQVCPVPGARHQTIHTANGGGCLKNSLEIGRSQTLDRICGDNYHSHNHNHNRITHNFATSQHQNKNNVSAKNRRVKISEDQYPSDDLHLLNLLHQSVSTNDMMATHKLKHDYQMEMVDDIITNHFSHVIKPVMPIENSSNNNNNTCEPLDMDEELAHSSNNHTLTNTLSDITTATATTTCDDSNGPIQNILLHNQQSSISSCDHHLHHHHHHNLNLAVDHFHDDFGNVHMIAINDPLHHQPNSLACVPSTKLLNPSSGASMGCPPEPYSNYSASSTIPAANNNQNNNNNLHSLAQHCHLTGHTPDGEPFMIETIDGNQNGLMTVRRCRTRDGPPQLLSSAQTAYNRITAFDIMDDQ